MGEKQSSGLQMEMFNAYVVYGVNINCEHSEFWLIFWIKKKIEFVLV